jgi:hypothetical protein
MRLLQLLRNDTASVPEGTVAYAVGRVQGHGLLRSQTRGGCDATW